MNRLTDHDQHPFAPESSSEAGQTMAEYAVTLTVITLAIVLVFTALGTAIGSSISRVVTIM